MNITDSYGSASDAVMCLWKCTVLRPALKHKKKQSRTRQLCFNSVFVHIYDRQIGPDCQVRLFARHIKYHQSGIL